MEFDMALAVPRGRPDIKATVERALDENKAEIHQILVDYGVPLVKCADCLVNGDLPSHGPYAAAKPDTQIARADSKVTAARMAELKGAIARGADPDEELINAVTAADLARVRYTLGHGANVNSRDGEGNTPLINASRFGFNDVATYLAEHKADTNFVDRSGWTPLMYAAWGDNGPLAQMLISHGARIDARDNDELTALAIAVQNGKAKAADALITAGADVNEAVAKGGYTPLMLASIVGSNEIAGSLVAHGAKVNAANPGGVTALMIAVANDHPGVAEFLLRSGADIAARSEDGRTALGIAQAKNSEGLIKLLQDAAQHGNSKSS